MSKSQTPHLITANAPVEQSGHSALHQRQVIKRNLASWARWVHIYLSMVSFAILFFFAVTGLTLNHPDWFSEQRIVPHQGSVQTQWLKVSDDKVDQLALIEHLRRTHNVKGALSDFRLDETQAAVSFKGPGYAADAFINRETGEYALTETRSGFVATLNDLHKGRDTGRVWAWLIDVSAVLMSLISLSGLALIWFIKRRRNSGLIFAVLGALVCYLLYQFLVP
jgi:hypothetical protein